ERNRNQSSGRPITPAARLPRSTTGRRIWDWETRLRWRRSVGWWRTGRASATIDWRRGDWGRGIDGENRGTIGAAEIDRGPAAAPQPVADQKLRSAKLRKACCVCASAMSEHQGWADLPNVLLHSVIAMAGSFSDLLAFACTCRSWREAFFSFPSKSASSTIFPPVLLQPDVPGRSPCHHPFGDKRSCQFIDPASQHSRLCCQIPLVNFSHYPQSPLGSFCFLGASYGHLIFSRNRSCLVVDAFTGVSFSPPQIPGDEFTEVYYGALTAPLASPNPHLLVTNGSHSYFWRLGSHSWLRACPCDGTVKQIVTFKGQVFGMDSGGTLFVVHLAPRIRVRMMGVSWGEISMRHLANLYLVACGDMLLLVGCRGSFPARGDTFEVFRLDQSTEHAKWVKVEELENCAIFISTDKRSQPLSFMDPERWGGRSNCVYYYSHDSEHWAAFELGKPASSRNSFVFISSSNVVQPMWVVPSMFSQCRDDGGV
uniref:KIB1-4 beta-propeller domain-containing protein n=1 Tax=Aegilops tauschii subsp. strangulata TaxID=200361 RepID=A0A453QFJ5_AEGTS